MDPPNEPYQELNPPHKKQEDKPNMAYENIETPLNENIEEPLSIDESSTDINEYECPMPMNESEIRDSAVPNIENTYLDPGTDVPQFDPTQHNFSGHKQEGHSYINVPQESHSYINVK